MTEWIVSGFYWEDWNDDEVPGRDVTIEATSAADAIAEYRRRYDPHSRCSRVTATSSEQTAASRTSQATPAEGEKREPEVER